VSERLVVGAEEVVEQLVVQCWVYQARAGQRAAARARAERTLERLLSRGLPSDRGPGGVLRLDPYAAANALKSRVGEPADEAWSDWQATTRRNAISLPAAAHRYRFTLRREWHAFAAPPGRPLVFRLPLPLREASAGPAALRLLEPAGALLDRRDQPGRVELRVDPLAVRGPVVAELTMEFTGGEARDDPEVTSSPLGAATAPEDEPWLRPREGSIAPSPAVAELAGRLSAGQQTARGLVHAIWPWLISTLRFGDVHRGDLDAVDPLGGLLRSRLADCVLGSSLLVALCRARGVPARLVSGFLLHPANLGPHSWAEVQVAPGHWAPFDFGAWCYSAGDPLDPDWGQFFRGRVDARLVAEVAPRDFTGWGSAPPPERWYRLERLSGDQIEHTLHALPGGALVRRDLLDLEILGPVGTPVGA
jgi:hypothetical protein